MKGPKHSTTKFKIRCTRVRSGAAEAPEVVRLLAVAANLCAPRACSSTAGRNSLPPFQYLYTLTVTDEEKANKLKQSLPPGLPRTDL